MKVFHLVVSLVLAHAAVIVSKESESLIFQEYRFLEAVDKSLKVVRSLLDTTRNPQLLSEQDSQDAPAVEHTWTDKYSVAELVTHTAIAATWNVLERMLMLNKEEYETLQAWAHKENQNVILSFQAQDSNVFYKEVIANIDLGKTDDESLWDSISRSKVVTKRTEYHWNAAVNYKILACRGSCDGTDSVLKLVDRERRATIVTLSKNMVPEELTIQTPLDLNLTWLVRMTKENQRVSQFTIDRERESCRTPSRNADIRQALKFQHELAEWTYGIWNFFIYRVEDSIVSTHTPATPVKPATLRRTSASTIFNPILPLMENGTVVNDDTVRICLNEQVLTMTAAVGRLGELFPSSETSNCLVSVDEASLTLYHHHVQSLTTQYTDTIAYIEDSLRKQLVQAIGKELTNRDFDEFMRFYNQKIFNPDFSPKPFSHAIRRVGHYPDGMLSIESPEHDEPIETLVRRVAGNTSRPIQIPISAAISVAITGDRYLHGWMQHRFRDRDGSSPHHLVARARQFSSFLVLIGTMAGPDKFAPKRAIILQNKDEVLIPLMSEILPSAKEFRDAIASLSPEQQLFAKEFRGMQLESTVFGVCVIQIKPQLEKLLGLPDGALTKEIQLTQDLLSLFVEYQIPSDLLSYEGSPNRDVATKVANVKGYVKAVLDVIESTKERQLKEEQRKAEMRSEVNFDGLVHPSPPEYVSSFPSAAPSHSPVGGRVKSMSADSAVHRPMAASVRERRLGSHSQSGHHKIPVDATSFSIQTDDSSSTSSAVPDGTATRQPPATSTSKTDFTLIPRILDAQLDQHDTDGALKSVVISTGPIWTRDRQENLLADVATSGMMESDIESERKKAMDLLDAISRSGSLPIEAAELHVIIGVAFCFDRSIIETVVRDSVNPIAKVEQALLLTASTIFGGDTTALEFLADGTAAKRRLIKSLPSYFALTASSSSPMDDAVADGVDPAAID